MNGDFLILIKIKINNLKTKNIIIEKMFKQINYKIIKINQKMLMKNLKI